MMPREAATLWERDPPEETEAVAGLPFSELAARENIV
jgi:hypothetical protein